MSPAPARRHRFSTWILLAMATTAHAADLAHQLHERLVGHVVVGEDVALARAAALLGQHVPERHGVDVDHADAAGFAPRDGASSNLPTDTSHKPLTAATEGFQPLSNVGAPSEVRSTSGLFRALANVSPATWLRSAAALWFGGSTMCAIWLAFRTWRFRRFLARAAHADTALSRRVAQLAGVAGLTSAPRVMVLESAVSPMLWGAGRGSRVGNTIGTGHVGNVGIDWGNAAAVWSCFFQHMERTVTHRESVTSIPSISGVEVYC